MAGKLFRAFSAITSLFLLSCSTPLSERNASIPDLVFLKRVCANSSVVVGDALAPTDHSTLATGNIEINIATENTTIAIRMTHVEIEYSASALKIAFDLSLSNRNEIYEGTMSGMSESLGSHPFVLSGKIKKNGLWVGTLYLTYKARNLPPLVTILDINGNPI